MQRRVFYVSVIAHGVTEVEVRAIVSASSVWNQRHDVTGMLVASSNHFAQALEGRDADIELVLARIRADAHHRDMRIQIDVATTVRRFGGWSMAYVARRDLGDEMARLHCEPRPMEARAAAFDVLVRACADVAPDL